MGQPSCGVSPSETSQAPAFKTPSTMAPDSFDGTQALNLRGFIQSSQLVFQNYPENFISERKKVLYSTPFVVGRDARRSEQEFEKLRMKKIYHVSLYIAYLRILMSKIGYWGERASIHVYRRGLALRLLDQSTYNPGNYDKLNKLMEITLELDTKYCERQKEKCGNKEKKPEVAGYNSFRPPQNSSSKKAHQNNNKGKNFQASKDIPHVSLLNKGRKLIGLEKIG
ncbi:hypothetical protein O181_033868 [Austropuccinia psidii MF-1]|uniref:Uncharacterized protein n=1 Tax=Austropuccinia psidii MF-1 TaxID=1389203 RepID=A0A9Q3H6U6_9BASI|nr:hypothetical protein [Austropuccinia psidii MF-1]